MKGTLVLVALAVAAVAITALPARHRVATGAQVVNASERGRLTIVNSRAGRRLIRVHRASPGFRASGRARLTYRGAGPARLTLRVRHLTGKNGPSGGDLTQVLRLHVFRVRPGDLIDNAR